MKANIYRELLGDARKLVHKKEYKQAAEMIIYPIWEIYGRNVNSAFKNVYLAGVSRIGKTRLADFLSRHGYLVISMDDVREFYWSSSTAYQDVSDLDACRNAVYQVLNECFPSGVCIEGSDVYFHAINRHQKLPGNYVLFALGVNASAVLPKAISMYRAAKNGYCRGLMTFHEAGRIAIIQSQMQEDLVGVNDSNLYYLEMMRCVDVELSLKMAEEEVLSVLRSLTNESTGSYIEMGTRRVDEKTFEERLSAMTVAHEQERDDLLLRIELLLKENERLKIELESEKCSTFSDTIWKKEIEKTTLGLDFSLPEDKR